MGTKAAPNYAINACNHFENQHVYTNAKQPLLWVRYIDDIFVLWQHGPVELTKFINHLNTCHQSFKFTHEQSLTQVNFLDTTVRKDEHGKLYTTLYTKPTDAHMYLHYTSSDPTHCKTGLPYSQFLRVRRICSTEDDFDHHAKTMSVHFQKRGYPLDLINEARNKAKNLNRGSLHHPVPKTTPTSD